MVDVGRNDRPAGGHLLADEFRRHEVGDRCTETFAVSGERLLRGLPAEVFANSDELHLRRDDAGAGIGELGHRFSRLGPERPIANREFRRQPFAGRKAVVLGLHCTAVVAFDIAALRTQSLRRRGRPASMRISAFSIV